MDFFMDLYGYIYGFIWIYLWIYVDIFMVYLVDKKRIQIYYTYWIKGSQV